MKSYLTTLTTPVLLLSCALANGSDINYEAGLKYSFFSYSDSEGAANLDSAFVPNLNIGYKLAGRGQRVSLNVDYYSTSGEASGNKTGQNAEGYGLTAKYHHQLNISRDFQDFWGGIGAKFSQIDLNTRHKIDSNGFLSEELSDKSVTTTALALSANKLFYFGARKKTAFNAGVFYDLPLGNGVTEFGLIANFNF